MNAQPNDLHFLQHAIRVGERGLGRTWPNPSVGCVLVKDGAVIAAARSADSGRPHAETEAIRQAGKQAKGATAYVSLEPCAHTGKTGPCSLALIEAGVARVVSAVRDPDARVNGNGVAMLREHNVAVLDLDLPEAAEAQRGFFKRVRTGTPYVALKVATSADGFMADTRRNRRWITNEHSRRHVHGLRGRMDAVLTGIGTVLADDPELTCRLPGAQNPYLVRVVADRTLRLPLDSKLVRGAEQQPVWVFTTPEGIEGAASHADDLRQRGVTIVALEGELAPQAMLQELGKQGITRLLVEAGPALTSSFLGARLVDTFYWYRAPLLLAEHGEAAFAQADELLGEDMETVAHHDFDGDALDIYALKVA